MEGVDVGDVVSREFCAGDVGVVATEAEEGVEVGVDVVVGGDALFDGDGDVAEGLFGVVGDEVGVTPVPMGTFCLLCKARSMSLIA